MTQDLTSTGLRAGTLAIDPSHSAVGFSVRHLMSKVRGSFTEFTGEIAPYAGPTADPPEPTERTRVVVEVNGKRLEVLVPVGLGGGNGAPARPSRKPMKRGGGAAATKAPSGNALTSPMQGTIVKIAVDEGQTVAAGDLIVVLEAMKMEQPITAHKEGTVTGLSAAVGQTVTSGAVICELKD